MATQPSSTPVVRFADFDFDMRTGELRRNRTSLKLQPQPAKVLALLVSRPGEIVHPARLGPAGLGLGDICRFRAGAQLRYPSNPLCP